VIDESAQITNKELGYYDLTADAAQVVSFGGCAHGNVLVVKALGGKVRLRITSADGSQQAVPVDSFLVLISLSVPFTAVDITREAGVETFVQTFIGQYG
jgi:hypothetical protein